MNTLQQVIIRLTPIIVFFLIAGLVVAVLLIGNESIFRHTTNYTEKFKDRLDRANIKLRSEDLTVGLVAGSAFIWAAITIIMQLSPIVSLITLPLITIIVFAGFAQWVDSKIKKRVGEFNNQLELILRMMSSGIRAGLGLRQAMIMVTEEMPEPARYEFNLVVLQMNIGMTTDQALTRLSARMPSVEMHMLTKVIAVQSQTGGNLGKTLDSLANTIKERRKLDRKVRAITSQARFSSTVLCAMPIFMACFLMASEPDMRQGLLFTFRGHLVLLAAATLEGVGALILNRMMQIKV